jgi:hypothetical protein
MTCQANPIFRRILAAVAGIVLEEGLLDELGVGVRVQMRRQVRAIGFWVDRELLRVGVKYGDLTVVGVIGRSGVVVHGFAFG